VWKKLPRSPLLNGLPDSLEDSTARAFLRSLWLIASGRAKFSARGRDKLSAWLARADDGASAPLTALAWAYALPELAHNGSAILPDGGEWWSLLASLLRLYHKTLTAFRERAEPQDMGPENRLADPLVQQWLLAELPLVLSRRLPEIAACAALADPVPETIKTFAQRYLDGQGQLPAVHWPKFLPWLACWTRIMAWEKDGGPSVWHPDGLLQFAWMIRERLRLTRGDGRLLLQDELPLPADADWLRQALAWAGDHDDRQISRALDPPLKKIVNFRWEDQTPELANNADWSRWGILRSDWKRTATLCGIDYSRPVLRADLSCGPLVCWSGDLELHVQFAGRTRQSLGPWEPVAWHADDDAQYLELEAPFEGGLRVQRQFVLAQADQVFLQVDSVLAEEPGKIDYVATWPLSARLEGWVGPQHPELELRGTRRRLRVLPLALSEWTSAARRQGRLSAEQGTLRYALQAHGTALSAPLWFDLAARRQRELVTWRPLTIAQDGRVVTADEAQGCRVQIGSRQWLLYRSLGPCQYRTVLGQHLGSEFLLARFETTGKTEVVLEIE